MNNFIKSPLNYVGGKYKILSQIIPLFPTDITSFVDLFGGGFNVGINVNCNELVYNDSCTQLVDLLENFYNNSFETINKQLLNIMFDYNLNRDIKNIDETQIQNNYIKLRKDYNKNPNWITFYALITCSFSNQIRFNSKGEFNMPYGKRYYNPSLQEKLKLFIDALHKKKIIFFNKDFSRFNFYPQDFIYCDPPYYNACATYNENGQWSEQDEEYLLDFLDEVNYNGNKFALNNNLKYDNPLLDKWKNKYIVHYLNNDYNNCNYQKKDKSQDVEILITNF